MERKKNAIVVCVVFAAMIYGGFLLCLFLPKEKYSDSERRSLAAMPELSAQNLRNGRFMSEFEDYTEDTFPFRDAFRSLKALTAGEVFLRQDNNGIYVTDGFISAVEYPLNEESLEYAAERFRFICENYLSRENKVFLSVIPDKNCFLAQESGHLSMNYAEFEEKMADMADFAEYIPISDLLEREDYYHTDTHWRQERITDVAKRLAESMGTVLLEDYKAHTLERDFYGVYYGQAALPLPPDTLRYMTGAVIDGCAVYDWQNKKEIPVYNRERAMGRDPYEMFLSGALSLITIENPQSQTNRRLILFRDSFGSAIAPLLISGYSQITLVDIRYIHPNYLDQFIDFKDCDILFLYSTLVLNHSDTIK